MKMNVGRTDKTIRIIAGLVILGLGLVYQSLWGLIGLLPLVTAFMRFCPAYTLLGMSTCGTAPSGDASSEKPSCCCGGSEKKSAQG